MQFSVTIKKEGSSDETRVMDLPNRFAVYDAIEKEGGVVTAIQEVRENQLSTITAKLGSLLSPRIKHIDIARMSKNLATMITAGLSLSRALAVVERESENKKLKAVAASVAQSVEKGTSFHEALSAQGTVFPNLLIAMVRVGEESGSLSDSLTIVGTQMERSDELTRKVHGALIYPAIILFAILIVSILMMVYVVPTLTKTFTELKVELPTATKIFIGISNTMVDHLFLVLFGIIAFLVLLGMGLRSRRGQAAVLFAGLHLPVVSDLIRETFAARTARTVSSLLAAGVPVLEALSITQEVVPAEPFVSVLRDAEERVKKGEALSATFTEHDGVYPTLLSEMLIVGEETGKVADLLNQAAEFYEGDVSQRTKDLSTIIEPALMLLIGAVVGIFAVSMIAPIYSLSSAI